MLRLPTTKLLERLPNVLWQSLVVSPAVETVTYSITRAPIVLTHLVTVRFRILTQVAVLVTSVVSLLMVLVRTVTEDRVQMVTQTLVSKGNIAIVTTVLSIVAGSGILHTRVAGTLGKLPQSRTPRPVDVPVTSRRNPYPTGVLDIAV